MKLPLKFIKIVTTYSRATVIVFITMTYRKMITKSPIIGNTLSTGEKTIY